MARHGGVHYAARSLFSCGRERQFFHREINPAAEVLGWIRNGWKSLSRAREDADLCRALISDYDRRFFLVPLQVPTDANLQGAACGWTMRRLVDATLVSFAAHAPKDCRLVFKVHPMARGHGRMEREIRSVAQGNGVSDRVDILETGMLGQLTRHCAGMITINSTSGLAAINHGRPLLVIGRSVYSRPELATCAFGEPDFRRFWVSGFVAPKDLRKSFLSTIARKALLPGDFYGHRGRRVAIRAIVAKLHVELSTSQGGESASGKANSLVEEGGLSRFRGPRSEPRLFERV